MYSCETCKASYCSECERENTKREARKVLGKGLIDVSKYVLTAVIITTFLGGIEQMWKIYVVGFLIALAGGILGYYLINNKK